MIFGLDVKVCQSFSLQRKRRLKIKNKETNGGLLSDNVIITRFRQTIDLITVSFAIDPEIGDCDNKQY